jgi:hypothetical protein
MCHIRQAEGAAALAASSAQGIEVEIPQKRLRRFRGIGAESPTPRSGDAPKNQRSKQTPDVSRVCQPPFADLKAESEVFFGDDGAERMKTRWREHLLGIALIPSHPRLFAPFCSRP